MKKSANNYAQYGLGYRFSNPYDYSSIPVDAAQSYYAMRSTMDGMRYRNDGSERYNDKQINRFSNLSAGLSVLNSFGNAYGQYRDNQREIDRLRRIKDSEYYNIPTDRYAYNSQSQNARQNVFYEFGGKFTDIKNNHSNNSKHPLNLLQSMKDDLKETLFAKYQEGGYVNNQNLYQSMDGFEQDANEQNDEYIQEVYDSTDSNSFFLNPSKDNAFDVEFSEYVPKFRHEEEEDHKKEGLKIQPVLDKLKEMGLTPSSVVTGAHNTGSKHYHGRAVDLGLNTTFKGDRNKMKQFKDWFEKSGKDVFKGVKLRDETIKPAGQKVWSGAHYHLEI